jgi:hypothetical protein
MCEFLSGTTPIFASIPGLSQDSGGSQDGGQGRILFSLSFFISAQIRVYILGAYDD